MNKYRINCHYKIHGEIKAAVKYFEKYTKALSKKNKLVEVAQKQYRYSLGFAYDIRLERLSESNEWEIIECTVNNNFLNEVE